MAYSTQAPRSRLAWTRRCLLRVRDQTAPPVGAARNVRTKAAGPRPSPASGGGSSYVLIAMDEQEFRRMLELFPVVRSRNYCADSGSSNKGTTQQARAQEIKEANKKESSSTEDLFLQKLKMAAEKKIGATKAELFCKTFEDAHEKLVYKELNLDAARRFLNAYER